MIKSGGGGLTREEALKRVKELQKNIWLCKYEEEAQAARDEQNNIQYSLGLSKREMEEARIAGNRAIVPLLKM